MIKVVHLCDPFVRPGIAAHSFKTFPSRQGPRYSRRLCALPVHFPVSFTSSNCGAGTPRVSCVFGLGMQTKSTTCAGGNEDGRATTAAQQQPPGAALGGAAGVDVVRGAVRGVPRARRDA